jgi:N-methylhydantoinase B
MEFQVYAPQTMVTARNRDRSVFSAWGLRGGKPGKASRFVKNPGTPGAVELGSTDIVLCEPNDIILIQGPGAGGYGDPAKRPPELVGDDVRRGLVSSESARQDYGVVLTANFEVDAAATERLRATMPMRGGEFSHGPGRTAFEAIWTLPRYDALHVILREVPVNWRYFVKHRVFAALKTLGTADDVYRAYEKICAEFEDLPKVPGPSRKEAAE